MSHWAGEGDMVREARGYYGYDQDTWNNVLTPSQRAGLLDAYFHGGPGDTGDTGSGGGDTGGGGDPEGAKIGGGLSPWLVAGIILKILKVI